MKPLNGAFGDVAEFLGSIFNARLLGGSGSEGARGGKYNYDQLAQEPLNGGHHMQQQQQQPIGRGFFNGSITVVRERVQNVA